MEDLALAFGIIFLGELGDKSQLMALSMASRYNPWQVLGGIAVSTAANMLLSVAIGESIGYLLPQWLVLLLAGVAFIVFGLWTLRGNDEDEEGVTASGARNIFLLAAGTFFVAEFGDKTMLATITLAASNAALAVWTGATLGMIAADAIAIVLGAWLGRRLPERPLRIGAAVVFLGVGVWTIISGVTALPW